jgi:quercetin dioxygenase-like cupin family protein
MKKVGHADVTGSSPEGTEGVDFRALLAEDVDPPNFYMRVFDVSPGGHTPKHRHDWEHEVYVARGSPKIVLESGEVRLIPGDAVYVEPNELHQFVNDGNSIVRFVCVIPRPKK